MLRKKEFSKVKDPMILLTKIHHYIFSDIYDWAGEFRKIDIIKSEKILSGRTVKYSNFKNIKSDFEYIINKYQKLNKTSIENEICDFIADVWTIHPFREGNTKSCLIFSWIYLSQKNIDFNFKLLKSNPGYIRNSLVMYVYDEKNYLLKIMKDALEHDSNDHYNDFENTKEEYVFSKEDYQIFKNKYSIESDYEK